LAKGLAPMLFFTDPHRTPDAEATVSRLPRGSAVVFRAFGDAGALSAGCRLALAARRGGVGFVVGADAALAVQLGADGLHLPERLAARAGAISLLRRRFVVTAAAHSLPAAFRAARAGADAIVLSPVFQSGSASAGRPMGPRTLARVVRAVKKPVYALGGVNTVTVRRLAHTGVVGFAAIEALVVGEAADAAAAKGASRAASVPREGIRPKT